MPRSKIKLDTQLQATLKDASGKLTGIKKRAFIAKATIDYFYSSPRMAETYMGWSRNAVAKGLKELETGIICGDHNQPIGRNKTEVNNPQLEQDIRSLVDGKSQADPKFQTLFYYARTTAKAIKQALIEEKGYSPEELPSRQTVGAMLNRMGYRLKKHKKQNH